MRKYILLIDDDEDEHLFFQWALEKIDRRLNLLNAYHSKNAMQILKHLSPDFIFLDINMPGTDGFVCLEEIQKLKAAKRIPVYMYSSELSDIHKERAAVLGASGCLKKSRSYDILRSYLLNILNNEAALKAHQPIPNAGSSL